MREKEPLYYYDAAPEKWLARHNYTDLEKFYDVNNNNTREPIGRRVNQSYNDLIYVGHPDWKDISLYLNSNGLGKSYCREVVPNFWYEDLQGRQYSDLAFNSLDKCIKFHKSMGEFYTSFSSSTCGVSRYYANNITKFILSSYNIKLETCKSKIDYLYIKNLRKIDFDASLFVAILVILCLLYLKDSQTKDLY